MKPPDWTALASQLGARPDERGFTAYSSEMAPLALDVILGESFIQEAADYCLNAEPAAILAEAVLMHLESWAAMQYCYELYQSADDPSRRSAAGWLLGRIGNHRAAPWISVLLTDADASVVQSGLRLLRRWLHYNPDNPEALQQLLLAEQHPKAEIRAEATRVRALLVNS